MFARNAVVIAFVCIASVVLDGEVARARLPSQTMRSYSDLMLHRDVSTWIKKEKKKRKNVAKKSGMKRRRRSHRKCRRGRRQLYPLYPGPGYNVRQQERSWGTFVTVMGLQDAFRRFREKFPQGPAVWVHDISKGPCGGALEPHLSHRHGHDADVRVFVKRVVNKVVAATARSIDRLRSLSLLLSLAKAPAVERIYLDYSLQRALYRYAKKRGFRRRFLRKIFQYPRGRYANVGLVRHWRGHRTHFHVRFFDEAYYKKRKQLEMLVAQNKL